MNRPIDLRPQDQAAVEQILRKVLPSSAKVWAFGSRARWTARDGSDLDLVIDAGRPLSSDELAKLRNAFEDSNLPFTVDMVDWMTISEEFRMAIKNDMTGLNNEKKSSSLSNSASIAIKLEVGRPLKVVKKHISQRVLLL